MSLEIKYGTEEDKAIVLQTIKEAVAREKYKRMDIYLNSKNVLDKIDSVDLYSVGSKIFSYFSDLNDDETTTVMKAAGFKVIEDKIYDFRGVAYNAGDIFEEVLSTKNVSEMVVDFMKRDFRFGGLMASQYKANLDCMLKAGETLYLNYFAVNPELPVSVESLRCKNAWTMLNEIKNETGHIFESSVPERFVRSKDDEDISPELFFVKFAYENDFGSVEMKIVAIAETGVELKCVLRDPEIVEKIKTKIAAGYHPEEQTLKEKHFVQPPKMQYSRR